MQSDRELLELAAKAAGYKILYWDVGDIYSERIGEVAFVEALGEWNPLTDDGDAFRLAVKFGFVIIPYPIDNVPYATPADPYAATRRDIVRGAARIQQESK